MRIGRPLKVPDGGAAGAGRRYAFGAIAYTRLNSVVTNAEGRFRLDGAPAGEPFVLLAGKVSAGATEPVGGSKLTGIDTFYPHAASPEDAEEITLSPDETRTRLEIRQVRAAAYCVSGTIHGSGASAAVIAFPKAGSDSRAVRAIGGEAGAGKFQELAGLPREKEYLFEIISADGGGARLQAAQSVAATNRAISME